MISTSLDSINNLVAAKPPQQQSPEALRQAAKQFESLLLLQLTSALNGSKDDGGDDEDKLFGSDGGTGLAKQMFSEQLATSMAQSGGVGLADLIANKMVEKQPKVQAAMKDIRRGPSDEGQVTSDKGIKIPRATNFAIGKSAKSINSLDNSAPRPSTLDPRPSDDGLEIVSTAADDIARYGDADLPKPVMGDPALFKYYRPRVVPDYALNPDLTSRGVENAPAVVNKASLAATNVVNYQMPVRGRISSEFGNRFHPIDKRIKFHAGIDIAAPVGTPIATAASGTVKFAGWNKGYGNMVIIEHPDGRQTRYGHASRLFVQTGDQVTAGQQIAAVGSTGKSTGPHLHFEMREDGEAVNPLRFLP